MKIFSVNFEKKIQKEYIIYKNNICKFILFHFILK